MFSDWNEAGELIVCICPTSSVELLKWTRGAGRVQGRVLLVSECD